MYAYHKQEGSS